MGGRDKLSCTMLQQQTQSGVTCGGCCCNAALPNGAARPTHPPSLPPAVAEVLRAIIGAYKDLFKVQQQQQGGGGGLSDALLFSNYGLAALVVDEVCREVRERCGAVRCECECGASASAVRCECAPPGGGGVQGWGVGGCVGCKGGRGGEGGAAFVLIRGERVLPAHGVLAEALPTC